MTKVIEGNAITFLPPVLEKVVQSYSIAGGRKVAFFWDHYNGLRAEITTSDEVIKKVSFCNIKGIPKQLRYHERKLKEYLKDTYVTVDNSSIFVMHRLKGGGNSHSRHVQQEHYQSPPPPNRHAVRYSAGFPIKSLNVKTINDVRRENVSGGVGKTHYSVDLVSQGFQVGRQRDLVVIHVLKKDYYAKDIASKNGEITHLQGRLEKIHHSSHTLVEQINSLAQAILRDETACQQLKPKEEKLSKELKTFESRLSQVGKEKTALAQQKKALQPQIFLLKEFLLKAKQMGLEIDLSHPSIAKFSVNYSKEKPLSNYDGRSLLRAFVTSLDETLKESQSFEGKDVIALVGNTGSGKSTMINHLLGEEMMRNKNGSITVKDPLKERAKIGCSKVNSETLYTKGYSNGTHFFADCGGFLDTRGAEEELVVMSSMQQALIRANSVKIAVCCDFRLLEVDRGVHLNEFLINVFENFLIERKKFENALLFFFTHADDITTQEAREELEEILVELKKNDDEASKKLVPIYEFLLRTDGNKGYLYIYDPLSHSCREEAKKRFHTIGSVKKEQKAFKIVYSVATKEALLDEVISLANQANVHFQKEIQVKRQFEEVEKKVSLTKEELKKIQSKKAQSLAAINKNQLTQKKAETTKNSHEKQVGEINNQIKAKQAEISKLSSGDVIYRYDGVSWSTK